MEVFDLTSDLSENEFSENHGPETNISVIEVPEFSDSEEIDEFPYKCQQCPEKFRQICEAQTHFVGAHQNSDEDTGKFLSEALLFAEHGEIMLFTKIVLNVRSNICTQQLGIFMY